MTPARLIASGLGTGFAPAAPGTAGSLLGLAVGAACLALSPWALAAVTVLATIAGLLAIPRAAAIPLRAANKAAADDPGWIVIDEIAGQCLALLPLPHPTVAGALLAFALFRLFDIRKPGPIAWADRQGGAAGIMADDLLAGLAAGALVAAAHWALPGWV